MANDLDIDHESREVAKFFRQFSHMAPGSYSAVDAANLNKTKCIFCGTFKPLWYDVSCRNRANLPVYDLEQIALMIHYGHCTH